jgi:hypothetical protein
MEQSYTEYADLFESALIAYIVVKENYCPHGINGSISAMIDTPGPESRKQNRGDYG